jgi:hypothetical protein
MCEIVGGVQLAQDKAQQRTSLNTLLNYETCEAVELLHEYREATIANEARN